MTERIVGLRAYEAKAAISVAAKTSKKLVEEKNKKGHLRYIALTCADGTNLSLKVTLDKQVIFNRTPAQVSQAGAGQLGLGGYAGAGGLLSGPAYAANAYVIILDFSPNPLEFDGELIIEVVNSHVSNAYSINDAYVLWDLK